MFTFSDGSLMVTLENNLKIRLIAVNDTQDVVRVVVLDPNNNVITSEYLDEDNSLDDTVSLDGLLELIAKAKSWVAPLPSFLDGNILTVDESFFSHEVQLRAVGARDNKLIQSVWNVVARLNQLNDSSKLEHPFNPSKATFKLGETTFIILFVTDKSATFAMQSKSGIETMLSNLFAREYDEFPYKYEEMTESEWVSLKDGVSLPDKDVKKFKSIKDTLVNQFLDGDSSKIDR